MCAISVVAELLVSKGRPKWLSVLWLAFGKKTVDYRCSRLLTCCLLFLEAMAVVLWTECQF